MATGVKQLLISPDGGTFTLGSGDASLEFPPGTVVEETSVRYAIILHGPFVIIYLNMCDSLECSSSPQADVVLSKPAGRSRIML